MTEQKMIDLETKISYQEVSIEELQRANFEQHLALEKLEKKLKALTDRFEAAMGPAQLGLPTGTEKPPHY